MHWLRLMEAFPWGLFWGSGSNGEVSISSCLNKVSKENKTLVQKHWPFRILLPHKVGTIKKHETTKQRRLENHGSKGLVRNPWSLEPRKEMRSAAQLIPHLGPRWDAETHHQLPSYVCWCISHLRTKTSYTNYSYTVMQLYSILRTKTEAPPRIRIIQDYHNHRSKNVLSPDLSDTRCPLMPPVAKEIPLELGWEVHKPGPHHCHQAPAPHRAD